MVKISKRELKLRNHVKRKFKEMRVDYKDKMILYGYKDGEMAGIIVQDDGLLTDLNEFIKYKDIISINEKTNISGHAALGLGLVGLALDSAAFKTIKILHNNGELKLTDIRKEEAIKFIHTIEKKIKESTANDKKSLSAIEEIKIAKSLFDDGSLTEEEFKIIKEKIIKKL